LGSSVGNSWPPLLNFASYNIDSKKKNTLIHASKEVGLEVNAEKIKHVLLSYRQNAGQNHDMKIANKYFENVAQFKYLGITNKSKFVSDRIMVMLLYSHILTKNVKITIYKTIILPVVLYGCQTWPLILRQEHRLRVSENRVLKIFEPKKS
jgi:hypothetical protein